MKRKPGRRPRLLDPKERELGLLYDLNRLWQRPLEIDGLVRAINRAMSDYLPAAASGVFLCAPGPGGLRLAGGSRLEGETAARIAEIALQTWKQRKGQFRTERVLPFSAGKKEYRLYLAYLIAGKELLGAVAMLIPVARRAGWSPVLLKRLLTIVGAQCTAGLQFLRSFERQTRRTVVDLPDLYRAAQPVTARTGPARVLVPIVDLVCATFQYNTCSLFLLDEDRTHLRLQIANPPNETETTITIAEDPLIQDLISGSRAILINDVAESPHGDAVAAYQPEIRSFMAVPMVLEGKALGTINLTNSTPNVYTEADLRHLAIIANQAALIYHTASELLNLEVVLQDVLESVPVGILSLDHRQQSCLANRMGAAFLELPADDDYTYPEMLRRLERIGYEPPGQPDRGLAPVEVAVRFADAERMVKVLTSPLRNRLGEITGDVIILVDVTEEKNLQHQLQRADRMAALGELSAGIAHEIKNPLTSIKGFTQLLPQKYDNEKFRAKFVNVMTNEVNRLNAIVEGMLSFAQPRVRRYDNCRINEVLDNVLLLVEHRCQKQAVELVRDYGESVVAYGDPYGLEQVFLNIAVNALDVMPAGGTLTVASALTPDGKTAQVLITDTGGGIDPKVLPRIFNPFFTTKATGTGLGLAISYRIIEEHNGTITVDRPGAGTRFTISIPVTKEA